jgi:hypothetical protein
MKFLEIRSSGIDSSLAVHRAVMSARDIGRPPRLDESVVARAPGLSELTDLVLESASTRAPDNAEHDDPDYPNGNKNGKHDDYCADY